MNEDVGCTSTFGFVDTFVTRQAIFRAIALPDVIDRPATDTQTCEHVICWNVVPRHAHGVDFIVIGFAGCAACDNSCHVWVLSRCELRGSEPPLHGGLVARNTKSSQTDTQYLACWIRF